ncbi:MAG: hypothetical protein OEZ01_07085 [Candidatus Heimdallarchaeota archaeon]|nr:hypothetical protein [Candidatus Heimdallarchaeota archaeon]MDH5645753.1 hypothetical protein [Candidatus Heimdallarchaeota archaeon]
MSNNQGLDRQASEFLLTEYEILSELLLKNDEIGENRLKFFMSFVTLVMSSLFLLLMNATNNTFNIRENNNIFILVINVLLFLLIIGLLTLVRLVKRNITTDRYKKGIYNVKAKFKEAYQKDLGDYSINPTRPPTENTLQHTLRPRKIVVGGVVDINIFLNSLIISAIFGTFGFVGLDSNYSINLLIGLLITLGIQYTYTLSKYYTNYSELVFNNKQAKLTTQHLSIMKTLGYIFTIMYVLMLGILILNILEIDSITRILIGIIAGGLWIATAILAFLRYNKLKIINFD